MRQFRFVTLAGCTAAVMLCMAGASTDSPSRKELKRTDLSGAPQMEVISSISEFRAGEGLERHFHHGIETAYVIEGTMVQFPGKPATMMETGTVVTNLRDVPHAGFKVVGPRPLRLFSVHIVDRDKPLYEWVR
jgi:quercetin dioxygenase-like cupin family protein